MFNAKALMTYRGTEQGS